MSDNETMELDELLALGNEGAPDEWLACLTGEGIGGGFEGIDAEAAEAILAAEPAVEQVIQATYETSFRQCNSANYTRGRGGNSVQYIVIHYTAGSKTAEGAAIANCIYFGRESVGASAHYFVDDGYTIWQSVSDGDTAWHAGNWAINQRSIGIEVCSAGEFTASEIDRLAWLVQQLMGKYGVPASRVIRHYDANGKRCPAYYVDAARWSALRARITGGAASVPTGGSGGSSSGSAASGSIADVQRWAGSTADGIYGPKTKAALVRRLQSELNAQFARELKVDGIWGPRTKAACVNVRRNASGNITRVLQGALICHGYDTGGFDGKFGSKTESAVRAYQRTRGLAVDGVAGPNTFGALLA